MFYGEEYYFFKKVILIFALILLFESVSDTFLKVFSYYNAQVPNQQMENIDLNNDYVLPDDLDLTMEEYGIDSGLSYNHRLNQINKILSEMGHPPISNLEELENKKNSNNFNSEPRPTRRTVRNLDSLGYVINEPNKSRDRYCIMNNDCGGILDSSLNSESLNSNSDHNPVGFDDLIDNYMVDEYN